jgi:endonuclease/exonuclease/phosphatase family metal-dependent hydrolase
MKYLISLFLLIGSTVQAQHSDTLRVMSYNLLYYGVNTNFCTTANNNVNTKNGHFQTIFQHSQPDVIGVQEMGGVSSSVGFLQNVLNTNGVTSWSRAPYTNTNSSSLVSLLYYNTHKLAFDAHFPITTAGRDIILYRLYYKNIQSSNDTIFLNFAVMHLKAGGTASDEAQRGQEAQQLMNYLSTTNFKGNLVIMGDFNVNSSSEAAYQQFSTASNTNIRLYDPVSRPGTWGNNSGFADLHTQAPTITNNGCTSGGGMDDRFDHIMINSYVRDDSARVQYVPGSYLVVGNDGIRFNGAVNSPSNQQVPPAVANALAAASDHLPVVIKLAVQLDSAVGVAELKRPSLGFSSLNQEQMAIWVETSQPQRIQLRIRNLEGRLIANHELEVFYQLKTEISLQGLPKGMYLLEWQDDKGSLSAGKMIKQ